MDWIGRVGVLPFGTYRCIWELEVVLLVEDCGELRIARLLVIDDRDEYTS